MSNAEIAVKALGGKITGTDQGQKMIYFTKNGEAATVNIADSIHPVALMRGIKDLYITCISQEGYLFANEENKYDREGAIMLGFVL